jgi:hypothetical protein
MTLNLMLVAPWGIWQCSDNRLTAWENGENGQAVPRIVDDYSVKHVVICCPNGAALVTYTGLGRIGRIPIEEWVRCQIRGEVRSVDQTLVLIRERATRDLAPVAAAANLIHTFSIGAFVRGQPWAVVISNAQDGRRVPDFLRHPPTGEFKTEARKVQEPVVWTTGVRGAVRADDWVLLQRVKARRPSRRRDILRLLAAINLRAKKHRDYGGFISASCITSYMPPTGRPVFSEHHREISALNPTVIAPAVVFGVDVTEMMRHAHRRRP